MLPIDLLVSFSFNVADKDRCYFCIIAARQDGSLYRLPHGVVCVLFNRLIERRAIGLARFGNQIAKFVASEEKPFEGVVWRRPM